MAQGYEDSSKLLEAKIAEYDSSARVEAGVSIQKKDLPPPDENMRAEVIRLLEDERRLKNMRFDEIY